MLLQIYSAYSIYIHTLFAIAAPTLLTRATISEDVHMVGYMQFCICMCTFLIKVLFRLRAFTFLYNVIYGKYRVVI